MLTVVSNVIQDNWKLITWVFFLILVLRTMQTKFALNGHQQTPLTPKLNSFSIKHPHYQTEFQHHRSHPQVLTFVGTAAGSMDQILMTDINTGHKKPYPHASTLGITSKLASYGSVTFDLEKDGYMDLFIAREDGVYFYKNNQDIAKPFSEAKIFDKQPGLTPYHLTIHDFNLDGNPDIRVRQFIDGNPMKEGPSVLLRNYNSYEWTDVSEENNEFNNMQTKKQSDDIEDGGHFIQIKLPKTMDYAGARVAVIVGKQMYVKYNQASTDQGDLALTFNLGAHDFIDRVRIRTIYNKEKTYLEPKIDSVLTVLPVVHFETGRNRWRRSSMGA